MSDSGLVSGLLNLVILCWFMVACPVACFFFSIFSDSMNLGGAFEKIGEAVVGLIFIPIIIVGKIFDAIVSPFFCADVNYAAKHANSLRD